MKGLKINSKIEIKVSKFEKWVTIETKKGFYLPLSAQADLIKNNINFEIIEFSNSDFEINEPNPTTWRKFKKFLGL